MIQSIIRTIKSSKTKINLLLNGNAIKNITKIDQSANKIRLGTQTGIRQRESTIRARLSKIHNSILLNIHKHRSASKENHLNGSIIKDEDMSIIRQMPSNDKWRVIDQRVDHHIVLELDRTGEEIRPYYDASLSAPSNTVGNTLTNKPSYREFEGSCQRFQNR